MVVHPFQQEQVDHESRALVVDGKQELVPEVVLWVVLLFVVQRLLSLLLQDVDQKEERHQLVLLLVVVFQLVASHLLLF